MGRDFGKLRRKEQGLSAIRQGREGWRAVDELEIVDQPTKADQRAELAIAMASFCGPVQVLDSHVALRCRTCGHRGNARVRRGAKPKFRCRNCSSTLIVVRG